MQFITRAYNNIVSNNINTITKSSSDIKLKKEFLYYNNVPVQLKIFNPRIIIALALQTNSMFLMRKKSIDVEVISQYMFYVNLQVWSNKYA